MRGNMGALLKQAQRVQENIKRLQVELAQLEVEGESSGGLAKVTMTCKHEVKGVKLDPSVLEEDIDMVEDLVFMAIKNCCEKIDETSKEKMAKATAGMPLPPGMMF